MKFDLVHQTIFPRERMGSGDETTCYPTYITYWPQYKKVCPERQSVCYSKQQTVCKIGIIVNCILSEKRIPVTSVQYKSCKIHCCSKYFCGKSFHTTKGTRCTCTLHSFTRILSCFTCSWNIRKWITLLDIGCHLPHMQGLLVTRCDNRTVYLWSLQGKMPSFQHKVVFRTEG